MQLFFNPDIATDGTFSFDKEESRHIVRVLRKQSGDILHVTNGKGTMFRVEITMASDNKCSVKVVGSEDIPRRKYRLHLAVAPTKMNDRYEWFLEKATEIGIDEITPLICDHSERKVVKKERFEKIVLSAMKQSAQAYLPIVNEAVDFKSFIKSDFNGTKMIAHCVPSDKKSLKDVVRPNADVMMLIGPEGDFSDQEIELALKSSFIPVTLGETRLRTETAAVVACHSVAFINQS